MSSTLLCNGSIETILRTNKQPWKENADIDSCVQLNTKLTETDVSNIKSQEFHDDIHDESQDLEEVLDNHYLSHLSGYKREVYILMHYLYWY